MPVLRQTSFAGGELAPTLYGRADLSKYAVGAKRLRNFFVAATGHALSRPGTTYVNTVKNSAAGKVRLIPFIYSDTQTYVLEFGNQYIRFYANGGVVLSGGVPYEVATPYLTADLPKLKFAQQGAVLTLVHPSYPPAELTWLGNTNWTYTVITFDRPSIVANPAVLHFSSTPASPNSIPIYVTADNSHQTVNWGWQVTEIWKDSRGQLYETAPFQVVSMQLDFYLPWNSAITYHSGAHGTGTQVSNQGTIWRCIAAGNQGNAPPTLPTTSNTWWTQDTTVTSPAPIQGDGFLAVVVSTDRAVVLRLGSAYGLQAVDPNFVTYRIYRGQGGLYGWIGDCKAIPDSSQRITFTDVGQAPDYTITPPQGTNPWKIYDSSATLIRTEYPGCVTFFENRRIFGRTNNRLGFIFGSAVNDYSNFDSRQVKTESDAIQFELASRKLEEIRSLVSVGPKLLALTNSAPWAISGTNGPLAYDNVDAKRQGEIGANWLDPLVIDGSALFARTKGTGVRSITEDFVRQSFQAADLSVLASHLFVGHQIVDWCWAEDPWGLVHAVRDDGVMLVLTFIRDQDVWAWSWYDTNSGTDLYENVCSVPEGQEDAVYMVVNRGGTRFIERQASRVITSSNFNQSVCLDCAGIYSGTASANIHGLSWLNGKTVWALADGNVDGPFVVGGDTITLSNAASYVVVGLPYTPELQQLDPALAGGEVKGVIKAVNRIDVEVDTTRGLLYGTDFNHLVEVPSRQVSDAFGAPALQNTVVRVPIQSTWDLNGSACIRQTLPLPVALLSLEREFDVGND